MKSNRLKVGAWPVVFCVAFFCSAAVAQSGNPFGMKQFSATVVMSGAPVAKARGMQGDMKIYRSGDKMRTSMGSMGYMVMDLTQHTNYMVMNNMCMQISRPTQQNPFSESQDATIDRSPGGSETVDGHSCKIENLTVTPHNGQPTKMKVWEAQDLKGFPVKIEMESSKGPVTLEYKDISLDEPAASLFSHPANCQQMPGMPGGPQ